MVSVKTIAIHVIPLNGSFIREFKMFLGVSSTFSTEYNTRFTEFEFFLKSKALVLINAKTVSEKINNLALQRCIYQTLPTYGSSGIFKCYYLLRLCIILN